MIQPCFFGPVVFDGISAFCSFGWICQILLYSQNFRQANLGCFQKFSDSKSLEYQIQKSIPATLPTFTHLNSSQTITYRLSDNNRKKWVEVCVCVYVQHVYTCMQLVKQSHNGKSLLTALRESVFQFDILLLFIYIVSYFSVFPTQFYSCHW